MDFRHGWLALLLLGLVACQGNGRDMAPVVGSPTPLPAVATAAPTATVTVPAPTATSAATATPVATATAYITPPPAGQAAIIPILMYHHLADLPAGSSELQLTWTVSPANFTAQMAWLAEKGYRTISMDRLADHLKRGQPLPAKPVVISFDDGWAEDYTVAYPVLKHYNMIGTFFVITNVLDHKAYLGWAQLTEMTAAGMDVQSHTLSHPHLRQLAPDAALKELVDSKAVLEKRLGKKITAFDYPDGEYSTAVVELTKRAGYESAVTIAAGYKQRPDEMYMLHRTRVSYGDTIQQFASRLP